MMQKTEMAPTVQPSVQSSVSTLPTTAVERLAAQVAGELVHPGDPAYAEARRVWNGTIDRYPALIVRCASTDDVVAAVNFARQHGLLLAVRGGGHNVAGHATCDGGLVIDLSPMKEVDVNLQARLVAVQGGATWGDVDAMTQRHGLATPGGVYSKTGVAGLTLGGGYGWLRGKYGLSCDNLVAAEVVTAAGEVIWANEQEHADLLWGLRGGGGNFGIVTTFVMQLHPVGPEVAFAFVLHEGEGEQMKQILQRYRDYCATAPDEVSTLGAVGIIPPEPELYPEELYGRSFVLLGGLYVGPTDEGERILAPLRTAGTPLVDASGIMPYVEAQQTFDHEFPDGRHYYWKSKNVQSLSDELLDCMVAYARCQPSPYSTLDIWPIGGAVSRIGSDFSAFHGRQAAFMINAEANWLDASDDAANRAWVTAFHQSIQSFSDGSSYLNFAGLQEEGTMMMKKAFGPHYDRLVALKQRYDPQNFFRLNQNISPTNESVH